MISFRVALLAEGVDRNYNAKAVEVSTPVALLAEGVDRNFNGLLSEKLVLKVALLAEGVDRNIGGLVNWPSEETSPSSRRAWIEMKTFTTTHTQ